MAKGIRKEKKENFTRKRALTSKRERNIKENIITNQDLKTKIFLEYSLIVQLGKAAVNVRHGEK